MEENKFKKFGGEIISDLGEYVRARIDRFPYETVYIGCDSDVRRNGRKVMYADVVAFYDNERNDGVHYIFNRELVYGNHVKSRNTGDKAKDKELHRKELTSSIFQRIWHEVERLEELGAYFERELEGKYKRMTPKEVVAKGYKSNQTNLVDIDLDINPEAGWTSWQMELIRMGKSPGIPKNRPNIVYAAAKAHLEGLGYRVRFKPHSWAATCAADIVCKGGKS